MKNTYFSNPHGLDEEDNGNISSAYDMAILYSYCMKNETFAKIMGVINPIGKKLDNFVVKGIIYDFQIR